MSSLRNAVKRKTHKERAQPTARKHLGLLEKKKDYKQRAVNYHKKEDRIKALETKASMRNPDEFYFGMNNSEVKGGKHRSTDKKHMEDNAATLGAEAVKIMKTQDLKYLRSAVERERKKGVRMKSSLHGVEGGGGKKTVFKDKEEARGMEEAGEAGEQCDDDDEYDLDIEKIKKSQKKPLTPKEEKKLKRKERKAAERIEKERLKAYAEMKAREGRRKELEKVLRVMELERDLQGKGRKRKVGETEEGVGIFKWRRQRKR